MLALEYKRWDKFCNVIDSVTTTCVKSNNIISYVGRMIEIDQKTSRNIMDFRLSRYACYLIVQNTDYLKEMVNYIAFDNNEPIGVVGLYSYNEYPEDAWLSWFDV